MENDPVEMIYVPTSHEDLDFTGERLTSQIVGDITFEHWHRYLFAEKICRGKAVLDLASGEGYGSALLASTAQTVTGLDIDYSAVKHASLSYKLDNLSFCLGTADSLPFESSSFDVVVSMETLEHIENHSVFVAEIKRVLKPDGVLLISTPNLTVYSGPFEPINAYHKRELFFEEFKLLLERYFTNCQFAGQFNINGNAILPVSSLFKESVLFQQFYDKRFGVFHNGGRSTYAFAIASNVEQETIRLSLLNAAFFHAKRSLLSEKLQNENLFLKNHVQELEKKQLEAVDVIRELREKNSYLQGIIDSK